MGKVEEKKVRTAKAGDELTPKAAARLRKTFPFFQRILTTKEACTVSPKSDVKTGQWGCIDCGEMFMNNWEADSHASSHRSHRQAWWTGERFEEP